MATALKLKLDIKKLKAAINSKATPKSFLPKLKSQLEKSEKELEEVKKTGKPPKKTTTSGNEQTLTALQKLIQKKKYKVYQGQGVSLEKDAKEGAFATGRRVSKGLKANQYGDKKDNKGNVYYEYRPNRLDVKQPKKAQKYPKLEKGGLMGKIKAIKSKYSGGGMSDRYSTEVGDEQITITVGGKEKTGYPVYAKVSGYAPKTVGVFPTKEAAEKKAMQLEKKNKLEDGGYMAKGGGIYSSEELYIVKVFDGKSGELLDMSKRVWAKNISQAQIMAMEDFEDEMKAKYGDHLRFKVEEAPSMMKKGGYMARGGMLEVGDMVMVEDSGYAKYFSEFDTSKPAKIISKDKAKVFGKVKYLYGLEMADGRKPFNKAMESMLTKVSEQGGYMAKGGGVSSKSTYVPNRDVAELSLILNKELKTIKGSDIFDGVYVKNSALSKLKARKAAKKSASPKTTLGVDEAYSKVVAKAKEYNIEAKDIRENLKKEHINTLIKAGLDLKDLYVIYFGIQTLSPTTDLSYNSSGLMSISADYVKRSVDRIATAVKENKFEIGLKYPEINWAAIIKKYGIQKEPTTIKGAVTDFGSEKQNYVYAIYKGKNVVVGTSIDRERYIDGKLDKDNYYKRDAPVNGKFEGGYWGIVTSSKEVMYDIAKMILSQKNGYVKDMELFINGLGGVHASALDLNKVEYEDGGMMAKGGMLELGDMVHIPSENKSGVVVNIISNGKHYTVKFPDGSKIVYDKNELERVNELKDGGYMAGGGEVGEGFLIRDMKEKLNKLFPYSFGFTVTNFEKEGDRFKNDAALLADTEKYNGLQDADIKSKLFFPQYKRDHDIRFRIYQGGENTYFYFILESEKGDNYIGQFGFKDRGDVSSDYITRFIAFLMEQYGLPFTVEHSVMAKGGYMAHGGELHRMEGGE